MPLHLSWREIALRLVLSLIAGAVIGLDRGERGRPAGLRTTILVCLAASLAMLQANLLLPSTGRSPDSFVVLDLMRLPLGILSGMGFIGAGAILRKDERVQGVTTAATLWFVTVMGLCFGGGQIGLGVAAFALGLGTLSGLKHLENRIPQDRQATFRLVTTLAGVSESEIREKLSSGGFRIVFCQIGVSPKENRRTLVYELRWRGNPCDTGVPRVYESLLESLTRNSEVAEIEWRPFEHAS